MGGLYSFPAMRGCRSFFLSHTRDFSRFRYVFGFFQGGRGLGSLLWYGFALRAQSVALHVETRGFCFSLGLSSSRIFSATLSTSAASVMPFSSPFFFHTTR